MSIPVRGRSHSLAAVAPQDECAGPQGGKIYLDPRAMSSWWLHFLSGGCLYGWIWNTDPILHCSFFADCSPATFPMTHCPLCWWKGHSSGNSQSLTAIAHHGYGDLYRIYIWFLLYLPLILLVAFCDTYIFKFCIPILYIYFLLVYVVQYMNFTVILGSTGICTTTPKDPDAFLHNTFYVYLSFLGTIVFLCLIAT